MRCYRAIVILSLTLAACWAPTASKADGKQDWLRAVVEVKVSVHDGISYSDFILLTHRTEVAFEMAQQDKSFHLTDLQSGAGKSLISALQTTGQLSKLNFECPNHLNTKLKMRAPRILLREEAPISPPSKINYILRWRACSSQFRMLWTKP